MYVCMYVICKIFVRLILVLATKFENLGATWPPMFFHESQALVTSSLGNVQIEEYYGILLVKAYEMQKTFKRKSNKPCVKN